MAEPEPDEESCVNLWLKGLGGTLGTTRLHEINTEKPMNYLQNQKMILWKSCVNLWLKGLGLTENMLTPNMAVGNISECENAWRYSQVVRRRSAKPLFSGSNPDAA